MLGSLLLVACALAGGWRGDGTGAFPAGAPTTWNATWRTELPGWSNASPVVVGDAVCVTTEPVSLSCMSADSGALRWTVDLPVSSTIHDDPMTLAGIHQAERDATTLVSLQQKASALSRRVRRGDEAAETELAVVTEQLQTLRAGQASMAPYLTPPNREQIGYATSTPASDGSSLYPLFGNGVVARVDGEGSVAWSRWLGELSKPTRGYGVGHSASPLLVDGVLVVPWQRLRGLDPTTGKTLWEGPAYVRYGTPAVLQVSGRAHLVTPDGDLIRAADGVVVHHVDVTLDWASPTAFDGSVLFLGGHGSPHGGDKISRAIRYDLTGQTLTAAWSVPLPTTERIYASPIVFGNRAMTVSHKGRALVLDLHTGAVVQDLQLHQRNGFLSSLVRSGDVGFASSTAGVTVLELGDSVTMGAALSTPTFRSTPTPDRGRVFVRTLTGLVAYTP